MDKPIETRIFLRGSYRDIKIDNPVNETRAMRAFAVYNGLRDCMFKAQGGWYKLCLDGKLRFATRTLYEISFKDLYDILKD